MIWRRSMKVVCVDNTLILEPRRKLRLHGIYTVHDIMAACRMGPVHLILAEVTNDVSDVGGEMAYRASRFRPVAGLRTDISALQALLHQHRELQDA